MKKCKQVAARIRRKGDQPLRISRQIRPSLSTPQLALHNATHHHHGLTDIRMINLGQEPDLGRAHRILFGQKELKLEDAACGMSPSPLPLQLEMRSTHQQMESHRVL